MTGRLKQRSYETKEGEKRTVFELDVDEVGPSLKYATAKVTKVSRRAAAVGSAPRRTTPGPHRSSREPAAGSGSSSGGSASYDEPPF